MSKSIGNYVLINIGQLRKPNSGNKELETEPLYTFSAEWFAMTENHAIFFPTRLRRNTLSAQTWIAAESLALKGHSFGLARWSNKEDTK